MNTEHQLTHCLAHSNNGKPNGCELRDQCERHLSIIESPDGVVFSRLCTGNESDFYEPKNGR